MNLEHYATEFAAAIEKSKKWKIIHPASSLPSQNDFPSAAEALPRVCQIVSSLPFAGNEIRLNCAGIHWGLAQHLSFLGYPCVPTVGNVLLNEEPQCKTSYQSLKRELNGSRKDSTEPFEAHVWLTFPDMHIIDATLMAWKGFRELPNDWPWERYVFSTTEPEMFSGTVEYRPMLVLEEKMLQSIGVKPATF